jgi:nucleoside-diphosphate-sugar epimerase
VVGAAAKLGDRLRWVGDHPRVERGGGRVLVTGAAGFIGSHLVEACLDRGWSVVAVDSLTGGDPEGDGVGNAGCFLDRPEVRYVNEDLLDIDLQALLRPIDHVFHFAARPGVRESWGSGFDAYTRLNITLHQRLLEAARESPHLKSFVFASSSSVYGDAEQLPASEGQRTSPVSPYGATKAFDENLNQIYFRSFGVPIVNLRFFSVYGPRQRPDMAFRQAIEAGLTEQAFTLNGDGEQTRDFTYVADAVNATLLAALQADRGRTFNIGTGTSVSMLQALEILEEHGCPVRVRRRERQPGDAQDTRADISRAQDELGYSPAWNLEDGLASQVVWQRGLVPGAAPS